MSRGRRLSIAAGTLIILVALLMDRVRGAPTHFGSGQVLLVMAGLTLATVAGLGSRLPAIWRGLGVGLINSALLLVLAEFGAGVMLEWLPAPRYAGSVHLAWYDGQPWIREYRQDFPRVNDLYRFAPFLVWEGRPFVGRTINVDTEGRRLTPGARCGEGSYTVFVFGGSAAWGVGSPDSGTMPAYLQAELGARAARPVCVVNHGERAYVTGQEVMRLERELRRGRVPDAVVLYDGLNDVNVAMQYGRAGVFQNVDEVERRVYQQSPGVAWLETWRLVHLARALKGLRAGSDDVPGFRAAGVSPDALADAVALEYHTNRRIVATLGAGYGFEVLGFLQPMIAVGHKPLAREERDSFEALPPGKREFFEVAYAAIRAQPSAAFADLSGVFDQEPRALYIDWFHVTPVGNDIVARRIAEALARLPSFPSVGRPETARPIPHRGLQSHAGWPH